VYHFIAHVTPSVSSLTEAHSGHMLRSKMA
jgi:hypothetical protein